MEGTGSVASANYIRNGIDTLAKELAAKHAGKHGKLDAASARTILETSLNKTNFSPRSGELGRSILVNKTHVYVKHSKDDLNAQGLKPSRGAYKKRAYATALSKAKSEFSRCVLLVSNDRTTTSGQLLPDAIQGNIAEILREEAVVTEVHKQIGGSDHLSKPADALFTYEKVEKSSKTTQKRIALVKPELAGDARKVLGDSTESPRDQLLVLRDTAKGLKDLRKAGYVHRDIKADNILFETNADGQVLRAEVTDFGYVIKPEDIADNKETWVRTCDNYPPEVSDPNAWTRKYAFEDDMYALGSVIRKSHLSYEMPIEVQQELAQLVQELHVTEPSKRPGAEKVIEKLNRMIRIVDSRAEAINTKKESRLRNLLNSNSSHLILTPLPSGTIDSSSSDSDSYSYSDSDSDSDSSSSDEPFNTLTPDGVWGTQS